MNLNKIEPKNETEELLLSLTKNCETLIQHTHRKAEQTLEFKLTKSRETFHFQPPISIEEFLMLGLTSLELYIFFITEESSKFEIYKFPTQKVVVFLMKKSETKLKET